MEELSVTYHGVEIEYEECSNHWRFELRGRERFTSSLAAAKEAIDKPAPKSKTQFSRVKAYKRDHRTYGGYSDRFKAVEITSVAETSYGRQNVWITDGKDRSKVALDDLYAATPENEAIIEHATQLGQQIDSLQEQRDGRIAVMSHPVVQVEAE